MNKIELPPDQIPDFLITNIKDSETVFIFSTDTVMNSWIEFLITHPETTGTDVLPLERFMAWDNFKRQYLKEEKVGTTSIPSILRKLFVQDFIVRNATAPSADRLKIIINPDDEKARNATSFADWISKNLPSLHYWKKRLDQNQKTYGELDLEDKDYLKIYEDYKNFLETNNLFEPAWLNSLNFSESNSNFIIMYPELLEDFSDFSDVLTEKNNITIVTLPENLPKPSAYLYEDSRSELRQTMLQIISLVRKGKADWSEISLSVPDIDTYRPYLEREFQLYEIPYVIKAGVSLTKNSAGKIFREIYNCYNENFSFDSIRALILDECVPWKTEHAEKREALIRVGNEMRCICSPSEKDIWLSAFQSKINRLKDDKQKATYYAELKDFYSKIKHHVEEFFSDTTFAGIEHAWKNFKYYFLGSDNQFSENANNILGRCISELQEIIQIENDFKNCNLKISNPFEFFLNEIDGKKYTPQQKNKTGVNIFAYKLSGPAYFKYQFVIDGSQKNLEIPYKRLTFLNATKRGKLHLVEEDKRIKATEAFINLYAKKTENTDTNHVVFSASESTFSGYAIPHSAISIITKKNDSDKEIPVHPNLDTMDYIIQERNYVLNPSDYSVPNQFTLSQKEHFKNWSNRVSDQEGQTFYKINQNLRNNLNSLLIKNRASPDIDGKEVIDEKIKITARSDLELFFPCPRKWLLSSVLKLHDDTLDTNLMQGFDMGNLNHKILELLISQFQDKPLPYYDESSDSFKIINKKTGELNSSPEDYQMNLNSIIEKAIYSLNFSDSPLVTQSLKDQMESISFTIIDFLKVMLKPFGLKPGSNVSYNKIAGVGNCTVVGCEKTLCFPVEKFDYYGKIDCLLKTPENDWIIIDYKNGAIPSISDCNADKNQLLKDFQMTVYCKLIGEETRHEIAAGIFYSISKKEYQSIIDIFKQKKVDSDYQPCATFQHYKSSIDTMEEYAQIFAAITDSTNGTLDFTPHTSNSDKDRLNVKAYENCIKCTFKGICRTTYNVGNRELSKKNEGAN